MNLRKAKGSNFNGKLCAWSFIIAVVVMVSMVMLPANGRADAVHYLRPYQYDDAKVYDGVSGEYFTMAGEKYYYGVISNHYSDYMDAEFNLGEKVSSVSFTLGHLDNQGQREGKLKIYLDNELQEECTKDLKYDMSNVTVTVNTAGKKMLKVVITGYEARYGMGNIIMSTGHNYKEEVTKVATVMEEGLVTYTCKDCGDTYQETIPARTHCVDYLSPYQSSNMKEYKEEIGSTSYVKCMGDKKYRCLKTDCYSNPANAMYNLNGSYKNVTFMIGHVDGEDYREGSLNIYVDGNQIKQKSLYYDMLPKQITIDTTNVTQLKLEVTGYEARYVIYDFIATPKVETTKPHSFEDETLVESSFGVPGVIRHKCSVCGAYYTTNTEAGTRNMTDSQIAVSLEKSAYVYSGKACTPAVNVTYDGTALKKGTDYAVSYSNNINAGTARVTISGLGYYKGQTSATFTIQPKKTSFSSVKNTKKGQVTLKWKKNTQADGYQIVYSTNSSFNNLKTKTVTNKTSTTLSGLSKGYTYYVTIRAYKKSNGSIIYSDFGSIKKVYIKK